MCPTPRCSAEQRVRFRKRALKDVAELRVSAKTSVERPYIMGRATARPSCAIHGSAYDRVRPGLLLYGSAAAARVHLWPLKPVMRCTPRSPPVKGSPGEIVGYGEFRPRADGPIAIIPAASRRPRSSVCGPRTHPHSRPRAPVVARCRLDMLTVDVYRNGSLPGDDAVIIGAQATTGSTRARWRRRSARFRGKSSASVGSRNRTAV